ncbi:TetR/AcrR family transcriptional regulator [Paenibacillus radicis (ex Gao et al. 2016)]|uniref:TetR family transcriptional regulator n=1 Tax=Paenibacillus radicis (ex Gao et al. 2016) TaxID=1737354 RepID=A0A917GWF8_9BACL|nr:TetR/AcrR family transcriptional regulator [Paenibacillus radicis (ex Gao et al. 2016)]GGG59316.1 TetR family transcriptional regulator [Paenibacillus radicis (ex Gao et al. 2016)]
MSRPREFDYDTVLHAAIDIFREYGYYASSYDILTKGTKLNKQSLYGAFGDKKALFSKSLSLYNANFLERFQQLLSHGTTALETLRYWQQHFLPSNYDHRYGCLIVNSTLELQNSSESSSVKFEFDHMFQRMKEMLEVVISKGQQEGSVILKLSSEQLSNHLVNTIIGLRVLVRSGAPKEQLQSQLDTAIEMLLI